MNKYFLIYKSIKAFYNIQQGFNEPLDSYYQRFENAKDLVELFDGNIADLSTVLSHEQAINSSVTNDDINQKFLAMCLVMNANKRKYEELWNHLENELLVNRDTFPTTIGGATHLLNNWKSDASASTQNRSGNTGTGNRTHNQGGCPNNVQFTQVLVPENNNYSSLPGYDPNRPNMVPSRKPPHNITPHITCT